MSILDLAGRRILVVEDEVILAMGLRTGNLKARRALMRH